LKNWLKEPFLPENGQIFKKARKIRKRFNAKKYQLEEFSLQPGL
jgi:hypothetical protein